MFLCSNTPICISLSCQHCNQCPTTLPRVQHSQQTWPCQTTTPGTNRDCHVHVHHQTNHTQMFTITAPRIYALTFTLCSIRSVILYVSKLFCCYILPQILVSCVPQSSLVYIAWSSADLCLVRNYALAFITEIELLLKQNIHAYNTALNVTWITLFLFPWGVNIYLSMHTFMQIHP